MSSLVNDKVLGVAPFKFKITTINLQNMKQKGYYAVSYLLNYHHKIMMNQTGFVYYDGNITTKSPDGKGSVYWNEEMEFQLPTTTLTLNWSLLHKLQEDNCVPTTLESGSIVLNSLPMQQMLTRMLVGGGGSSVVPSPSNNNLSVTIQMTLTRNDSALKVLTRQQYQARQALRNHQSSGNKVNNTDSNDSDNMFFTSKKQYGAIYITFQEIMNQTYFPYLSTEWCKDCIQDTNHLVETFVTREIDGDPDHPRLSLQEELEEQGMMLEKSKRPYLKLFNGSKIYFSKFSSNFYHKHEHHHINNFDDVEQFRSFPIEEEHSVLLIIREIRDQKERNEFKTDLAGTEQDENEKEQEEIEVPFVLISFTNRYLLWNFIKWFQYAMNYWPMISKHPSFITASTSSKESFQSWIDIITPPVWIIEENMIYETDVKIYFYENQSHYHGKMKLDLTKFFTLLLTKENNNNNSNNNVSSNNINSNNDIPDIISLQSVCAMVLSSDAMNAEESMIQIEAQHCELIRGKRIIPLSEEKSLRSSPITTSGPSIIDPKVANEKNTKGFLGGLFSSSYQTVKNTTAGVLSNTVGTLYPSKDSNQHHQDRIIIKCEGKDYALTYDPTSHEWIGKMFIENSFSQNLYRRSSAYHQSEGGFSLARKKKGMRDIMARKEKIDSNQVILGYCSTTINSGITLLLQKGSSSNDVFLHSSNKESSHSSSLGTGIIGQKYLPLHRLYPLISIDSDAKTPRYASDYLQDNINYRENEVLIEFNTKLGFSITLLTSEHPSSIIHQYDEKVYGLIAKCKFVDRDGVSIASSLSSNTIPLTPSKGKGRHQKKKKSSFFGSAGKSSQTSDTEGEDDIELNWNNFNFILSTFHGLEKAEYVRIELIVVLYANRYLKKDSLGGIFIPIGFFRGSSQTATIPIIPFRKQGLPSPFNAVRENASFSKRNFDGKVTNAGGESGFLYGEWCYGDITVEIKRIEEPLDQNQTFLPAVSLKISSELAPISGTWWMTEALLKGTIQTLQHSSQVSSAPSTSNYVTNDVDINPQHVTTCWIHLGYNELLIDVSEAILAKDHISRKNPQTYRSQMNKEFKNHILLTCEELHLEKMMVILPYDQILSAAAVTSSILSMELNIGRYFDSIVSPSSKGRENENTAGGIYRKTTIVCYVSNCPARNLYQYIEDRKFFALIRFQLYQILHETRQVHHLLPSETIQSQEEKDANNQLLSSTIHLFIEMNNISSMLESRLQRLLFAPFEKTATPLLHSYDRLYEYRDRDESEEGINTECNEEEERIEEMISELGGRICRLRLYTSILFGLNITCSHQFETSSIHAMVDQDIQFMKENILLPPSPPNEPENAQTLVQPESASTSIANEISRMNEGIDYLLEICEHRLIETMICGWNLTNTNQLFLSLEIMINRYFIEIIALLSRYFEDSEQTIIQGISNKMEIIHSYLKYHNKLAIIIQRLLLPYGIVISPLPTISLFLDFSVLISWYMSSLVTEMRKRVDNVIAVWKDRSKDVTGEGNYYTSVDIPWIPQRISVSALLDRDDNNNEEESDYEGAKTVGGETTKTTSTVDTDDASTTISSTRKRKNLKAMKTLSNVEYFLTNIPEDILMILNSYLQYTRIHLNDHRQQQQSSTRKEKGGENTEDDSEGEVLNHDLLQLLEELNHKIYISYFHSLLYLIHEYYEKELLILISNFYRNHSSSSAATTGSSTDSFENEQTEYIIWMCSVVNDCYRMMNYPYIDHLLDSYSSILAGEEGFDNTSSSSKEKKGGLSNNEEEEGKKRKEKLKKYLEEKYHAQIEEVIQGFKRVYQTAIHQISCYIFHSIFLEEHLLYQDNFFTAWYHGIYEKEREKEKGRVTPASPPDESKEKEKEKDGFSTKRRGSGTNSIGKMDLMKLLTQDLCQFLEEIIYYFMYSDCQIYQIEICIDKMMIIFYYLLRNARNHHLLFHESSHHPLLNHLINDFHYYQSSILQFSHQVYSVMSSIAASTTKANSSISSTMITSSSDKILLNEDIIVKRLTKHMKLLDNCLQLIDEEIMSNHFITIIKELYDECTNNLKRSFSLFKLLIICLALKGIKECYPKKFHLLNIIPNNNTNNSNNNNAASNVLGSVKTPSPPTPPPNSEGRGSESKDTTTATNTNTASTPVVISDVSNKPPRIIHFPIYHRIESAIKGHLHSDSSKPTPNTTATITSSTSNSRSVSKDEPNDLQPRLSAEEVNLMYQETFTKEVENLKNQIGYDWILSILNDIQQHHHQFNLIIDKNSHLTITDLYLKLVQSITFNEEEGHSNSSNHVLVLKEYELLQQLTLDDFTPECFIFGILKKHKYSLKQLLLTTIPIYLQYQTTDNIPSLASSSLLSSFTSQLEEETSGKFSTVIGGGGGGSGGSGVINPLHAFQLWRKRIRKNLLHHNNPFTNTNNKSDNSDIMINPFHPNHYKVSLFKSKGFHPKKLLSSNNSQQGNNNMMMMSSLFNHKKLTISNIQIIGVISFLQLIPSTLYLQFQLNEMIIKTKPKSQYYNNNNNSTTTNSSMNNDQSSHSTSDQTFLPPHREHSHHNHHHHSIMSDGGCIFDETIELPITLPHSVVEGDLSDQKMTLKISLFNSGYLMHQLLATTSIEFFLISPPNFRNKIIEFDEWIKTFRIHQIPGMLSSSSSSIEGGSGKSHYASGKVPRLKLSIETLE